MYPTLPIITLPHLSYITYPTLPYIPDVTPCLTHQAKAKDRKIAWRPRDASISRRYRPLSPAGFDEPAFLQGSSLGPLSGRKVLPGPVTHNQGSTPAVTAELCTIQMLRAASMPPFIPNRQGGARNMKKFGISYFGT